MNFAAGTTYHKGISFYLGELGGLVDRGLLATLPPARLEVMRTRASALLGLVADADPIATSPAVAAQLVQLQSGIGDKGRNLRDLIPEVVALARLVLPKAEGTNGAGLLGLFGSVPGASQQLQVVKKFIRERLSVSRDLLVRLKRVREQAAGLEQLGRHDRALLQQIDEAVDRQKCLAASVETLDDAHAIDASHQATNHYLHASLLESVFLEHARLGPLLRDAASPVPEAIAEPPPGNGGAPHETPASISASASYRPLWPEHFTLIPAWSRCNLVDYCAAFGVDLSEVDADSFKRAVGVTPRTIIGWSHSDNRPAKIGYVVALYRYLVESASRQQEVERQAGTHVDPVELPDPMDLLRLVCGSWGDPLFVSHVMGDPRQVMVPIPYQIADIPADRISYGPVLRRIRETIAPSAQDDINWLLQGYHRGAITGDTFQDHAAGRVSARARTRKSRDTVRVFLGDSFNFFLEIQPYLRAVGVLTEVPSRRMFGDPSHSQYRIRLVPDQVAVDWASVRPKLEPDQAPYAYYLDGRMSSFLAWLRQRMKFMRLVLGWQDDWPITINGLKLQTFAGLEATLDDLSEKADVETTNLSECLKDPSQITPRTETDAYELTRRILRFHRSLETIAVLGHVTHGPLAIDYRFVGSSEAAMARAWQTEQGYMVALDPGPLIQKWLSGGISNETAGQLFHYRVVREAMRVRLAIRDQPGDFFDEALCKFLFPESKKRDLESLLKSHQAWTQAAKGEGIDPLCLDPFALQVLDRMSMNPRRTTRPVGKTSLTQQIVKYFYDNYGVPPANAEPLVTGLQTYLDTEGNDHFADGRLLGMLATLFTEEEITSWKPVFLDLLAYLGFPNGDAELAAKVASEIVSAEGAPGSGETPTVIVPGQLSRWLEAYLLRQGQTGDANLCWLRSLAQRSVGLLAGEMPDASEVDAWERDFQAELTQTLGLLVTPGLGLPFLQAMARELSRVTSDNFRVDEDGIERSEALTTIQRRLMADEISDVPELLSVWLSETLEQVLRSEQQLLDALRETSNAKPRDQVGWRALFFTRAIQWPALGVTTANWEDVLRRHETRMELLHPGHPNLVRKNMEQALASLPEVYIPELAPIQGCQQALVAYAAARGEIVTVAALAERIRRFFASAPDDTSRNVVVALRQKRLETDVIGEVATEMLAVLAKTIRRVTPESEAFKRAQRAVYEGLEKEQREADELFGQMDTLLHWTEEAWSQAPVKDREGWQELLLRLGNELGVENFPATWGGWETYLENLELRGILARRPNPLEIRQRVAGVLAALPPRTSSVPVPKAEWSVEPFHLLDEVGYATFWREMLSQIPVVADESMDCHLIIYRDEGGNYRAAFLQEASWQGLGSLGVLNHTRHTLTTVYGDVLVLENFRVLSGQAGPIAALKKIASWAMSLTPDNSNYVDVQFLLTVLLAQGGIAYGSDLIPTLEEELEGLPVSLRERLNRFYRDNREKIDRNRLYFANIGVHPITTELTQQLNDVTGTDPRFAMMAVAMLDLPYQGILPAELSGPLAEAIGGFTPGAADGFVRFRQKLESLWPQMKRHFYGRGDELSLVSRAQRRTLATAMEGDFRTPGIDPERSLAFGHILGLLRPESDRLAARALVRIFDPFVTNQEPPYVGSFVKLLLSAVPKGTQKLSEAVVGFYQRRRAELLWRLWEERHHPDMHPWIDAFLPEMDQMPPRFALSSQFPELEAMTYAEIDRFRFEYKTVVECLRNQGNYIEISIVKQGLISRIILPQSKMILRSIQGQMLAVGIKGSAGGGGYYFRSIVARMPGLRNRTIPVDALEEVTFEDVTGTMVTLRDDPVFTTAFIDANINPDTKIQYQGPLKILLEDRLRDLHPLIVLMQCSQFDSHSVLMTQRDFLMDGHALYKTIVGYSAAEWALEATIKRIRSSFIDLYRRHHAALVTSGLDPRFIPS